MTAARPSDPVDYAYDAAGRLVGVSQTNTGANTGRYNYDDSGNLLSIDRFASTTLSILSTVPARASVGSTITLSGTAFGATPAANTVKFNGTTATVSAATARTLTVAVPTGATTGPITVTTSAGTATSAKPFTVDAASLPPTISAFSPALAAAGGTVTITGTGFDTTPATTIVSIGKTRAVVTAATATSVTVTVPDAAGSGPLTVVTPGGSASSANEFVAVPKGYAATDVATTPTITADGASATLTAPAGKVSLLRFSGTKGQRLSLGLTGSTITSEFGIAGFAPFGAPFARHEMDLPWLYSEVGGGLELPPLPFTGTYQFVIDPSGTGAGAVTATLSSRITGALNPTGAGSRVTLGRAGQLAELTFPATAGKDLHIGFTSSTFTAGSKVVVSVREPNGSVLLFVDGSRASVRLDGSGDIDFATTQTGNYTVLFGTSDQGTGAVTVTGSTTVDAGQLVLGENSSVIIDRPGQDARLTYAGTAGQVLNLDFTGYTFASQPFVTVYSPDGSVLTQIQANALRGDIPALPTTGTYAIFVSPYSGTGLFGLRLTQRQDAGTLTATGTATSTSIAQSGRTASFQFAGTAGQSLTFGFTGVSFPAGVAPRVQVVDPQGAVLFQTNTVAALSAFSVRPTVTGAHRLLVTANNGTSTGTFTVTMAAEISGGDLAIGSIKTITAARVGQSTAFTFTGAVGQRRTLVFSDFTFPHNVVVQVVRPDGGVLLDGFLPSLHVDLDPLTAAGTYRVVVLPAAETGSVKLFLAERVDLGTTAVGGAVKNLPVTQAGRFAETSFTATAGQWIDFAFTGWTFSSGTQLRVRVLNSAGTAIVDGTVSNTGVSSVVVSATGTYRLVVYAVGLGTGAVDLTASVQTNAGTISLNTAKNVTFPRVGQSARMTFSGVAGQRLVLGVPGATLPVYPLLHVLKPDGTVLISQQGGPSGITIPALPVTGTYAFVLIPFSYSGAADLSLTTVAAAKRTQSNGIATTTVPLAIPSTPPLPSGPSTRSEPLPISGFVTDAAAQFSTGGLSWTPDARNLAGEDWSTRRPTTGRELDPLRAPDGTTALSGRVRTLDGRGLAHVTVTVDGKSAKTDDAGRFLLAGLGSGHRMLRVNGATSNTRNREFGLHDIGVDLTAGKTTVLPYPLWLSALDTAHVVKFPSPTDREVVVTNPAIPGLEVHLPRGAVIRDVDGKVVTELGITAIPIDRPPFPLPNSKVPSYFTVQPGSAYVFPTGARVVYPNITNATPGTVMDFWHYDPVDRGWFVYGHGKVTPDAKQVVPDEGTEVYQFTGAMLIDPAAAPPPENAEELGETKWGGDPVNLATGLLTNTTTDLAISDTISISSTRTYQHSDTALRTYGVGTNSEYNMFLYSNQQWVDGQLILPNGSRVRFHRITPGSTGTREFMSAAFLADPTPTRFSGAVMVWNGNGFDIRLRDGTTYVFGEEAPLQAIRDRFGNTVTITRAPAPADVDGRVRAKGPITQVTSPNGKWIAFTDNTAGQVTQARDNAGRTVGYTYDGTGHLSTVTDTNGGVSTYTYDSAGRMATAKDARGTVYLTNTYDTAGRVKTQVSADSGLHTFDYVTGTGGKITETKVTDPRGSVRKVTFNGARFSTSDTEAFGTTLARTTVVTRDPVTNVVQSSTDPLGRRTDFGHDAFGNVTSITQLAVTSAARSSTVRYDGPFDQVDRITDWLGKNTAYGYHPNGALKTVADPVGRTTTMDVLETGQVKSVTDPAGKTTGYAYALGDPVTVTDPLGRTTRLTSDTVSQLVAVRDSAGSTERTIYDKQGRVLSTIDPLGRSTTYAYDPNGNLKSATDPGSHATTYTYDLMNRVKTVTDPLNRVTRHDYDLNGNLTTSTSARGKVAVIEFDALDRLSTVRYGVSGSSEESRTTYGYDLADRLLTAVDSAAGTSTFTLNDRDQLTRSVTPQGTLDYTYDAARRTSMTVPGQAQVLYGYDDAGRPVTVSRGSDLVTIGYDTAGRRKSVTLPNGITQTYGYDDASQLGSITYARGTTTVGNLTYDYTPGGLLGHIGGTFARADVPAAYGPALYDNANQLTSRAGTTFTYDNDGNQISDGTTTSSWNARGQLVSSSRSGQNSTYTYDSFGRRIGKTTPSGTTSYLHNGNNVVQESSGSTITASLLTGATDEVFTRTSSGTTRSLLTDRLGSTVATSDSAGVITGEYGYQPYGATTLTGDDGGNPTRFTGRDDDGNGQYFYRGRFYNTTDQRFLSQDPIGFAGGDTNLFTYAANQPTTFTDPMGTNIEAMFGAFDDVPEPNAIVHLVTYPKVGNQKEVQHALITIIHGDKVVRSEQFGSVEKPEAGVRYFDESDLPLTTVNVKLSIPFPERAIEFIKMRVEDTELGGYPRYDMPDQACVTYCAQVLRHGGISEIPANNDDAQAWLGRYR